MKRFFALLLCLSILFSISAANNTGRIGIQFAAQGYIGTDESPANAQEVAISVSGANFFGEDGIFGIGYSFGYGFSFDGLENFKPLHFGLDSIFSLEISDSLSIEPKIGLADTLYIFDDITSNEFGIAIGCGFEYEPINHLGINAAINYTLPIVSSYKNSISTIAFDKHVLSFGLAVNYLY